ncbi:MAG: helix-turn-helix domain-containing protein [Candidatus Taylorbacteria bacterium]
MIQNEASAKKICKDCPIARTAQLIGDTWSLLIIRDLFSGPKRFGELASSLAGVSSRTLTKKLQLLESHHIISREEYSEKPPRVEYSLTKKGKELNTLIDDLRLFGEKYKK